MLSITAISAGAIDYLLRGSGCAAHDHPHGQDAAGVDTGPGGGSEPVGVEYLLGGGLDEPSVWFGGGLDMVGIVSGSVAREADVRAVFGQLRHPDSTEEEPVFLGRPPRRFRPTEARIAVALAREPDADPERKDEIANTVRADGRKAVAYYDLTFSPVKSVSVYWAALIAEGRRAEADLVVAAHREAIAEAMRWAEREAAYTRVGYHGKTSQGRSVGRFEKATGLVWTRWEHQTNRNQEPQLHAHVAVLNRVVTESDGQIRALDGRGFAPIKRGIDAIYTAGYESRLSAWLGVVFAERPDGKAREIMGVDQRLCADASTRHTDMVTRASELEQEYERRHGRAPSPSVRTALARAAVLATRAAKSTRTPAEQVRRWCATRHTALRVVRREVAAAASGVTRYGHPDQRNHRDRDTQQLLADAVARTQAQYATWDIGNLIEAITAELHRSPGVTDQRADELATQVLTDSARYGIALLTASDVGSVPPELRRSDGKSRYRAHHDERYATLDQLACETGLVALSRAPGAPALAAAALVRCTCARSGHLPDRHARTGGQRARRGQLHGLHPGLHPRPRRTRPGADRAG
jgi:conjugative relaxase-like TrwC/TraI family protein